MTDGSDTRLTSLRNRSGDQVMIKGQAPYSQRRLTGVDWLRGLALAGTLMTVLVPMGSPPLGQIGWPATVNRLLVSTLLNLLSLKPLALLAFLFGWGASRQLEPDSPVSSLGNHIRRAGALIVTGLGFSLLAWHGDLLLLQGLVLLLSTPLLLAPRRSAKVLLPLCMLAFVLVGILTPHIDTTVVHVAIPDQTGTPGSLREPDFDSGAFWELSADRLRILDKTNLLRVDVLGVLLSAFLSGVFLVRLGAGDWLAEGNRRAHIVSMTLLSLGGLLTAARFFPTTLGVPVPPTFEKSVIALGIGVGDPTLAIGLALLLAPLFSRRSHGTGGYLAGYGRMALSNYALTLLVLSWYFYGYGLGAYGRVSLPVSLILLGLFVYLSAHVSQWWLGRHDLGPLEYGTRLLTYGWRQMTATSRSWLKRAVDACVYRLSAWYKVHWLLTAVSSWLIILIWAGALTVVQSQLSPIGTDLAGLTIEAGLNSPTAVPAQEGAAADALENPSTLAQFSTPNRTGTIIHPAEITTSADPASILDLARTLSSGQFRGRLTGSDGGRRAAGQIAGYFNQFGLQPGGDNGTYLQPFPVAPVLESSSPRLTIEPELGDPIPIQPYEGFTPVLGGYLGPGSVSGRVVWASDCTRADLQIVSVENAIVFCRSLEDPVNPLLAGAAGALVLEGPGGLHAGQRRVGRESFVPVPLPAFVIDSQTAESLLIGSELSLAELLITYEPKQLPVVVQMEVSASPPTGCRPLGCEGLNVVGVLPGNDEAFRDEAVLVAAAYDGMGTDPGGRVWQAANESVAGTSVLLEMARILKAQDLVFHRTVIFAAVDGSQLGDSGIKALHDLPVLEGATVKAFIHLGTVGGEGDQLLLTGTGQLVSQLRAQAGSLGLDPATQPPHGEDLTNLSSIGPAVKIGFNMSGETDRVDLTLGDTVSALNSENLIRTSQLVLLQLTTSAELDPSIDTLLHTRQVAIQNRDRESFLATTHPTARQAMSNWFDGLLRTKTRSIEIKLQSLLPSREGVTAQVLQSHSYELESGVLSRATSLSSIEFAADGSEWMWQGPKVESIDPSPAIWSFGSVEYLSTLDPARVQDAASALDRELGTALIVLGLSQDRQLDLVFLESEDELRLTIDPSLPTRSVAAYAPRQIAMVMPNDEGPSDQHLIGLYQALLGSLGVDLHRSGWIWSGVPFVLASRTRPIDIQTQFLPEVLETVAAEGQATVAADWARSEYLRRRLDWHGLGRFLATYGQLCAQSAECADSDALEPALRRHLGIGLSEFEEAWPSYWNAQYQRADSSIDQLLLNRESAVIDGDEEAFLAGISPSVPGLRQEQQDWFQTITSKGIGAYHLEGTPVALLSNDRAIARVSVEYTLTGVSGAAGRISSSTEQLFEPSANGLAWAGAPLDATNPGRIRVLFPNREYGATQLLLQMLQEDYPKISAELGRVSTPLVVKLYPDDRSLIRNTAFGITETKPVPYVVARGEPFHVVLNEDIRRGEFSTLLPGLVRYALVQSGVNSEWVLSARSITVADRIDQGGRATDNARHQLGLQNWIETGLPYTLDNLPPPDDYDSISREEALSLDTFRYLEHRFGTPAAERLISQLGSGDSVEEAVRNVTNLTLAEFMQAWSKSFMAGHLDQTSIETVQRLQADEIERSMAPLLEPELQGRRGGTPGGYAAANVVGEAFARLGLIPLPGVGADDTEPPEEEGTVDQPYLSDLAASYWTPYRIPFQDLVSAPRLLLEKTRGGWPIQLAYRQDFLLLSDPPPSSGYVQDRILYVRDLGQEHLDPTGWIVLVEPHGSPVATARQAFDMGAAGVLLVGRQKREVALFGRHLSLPTTDPLPGPVFTLTDHGFRRLLAAADMTVDALVEAPPVLSIGLTGAMSTFLVPAEERISGNVIGVLPGTSPELRDQAIVIGAHYDHVGDDPETIDCNYGLDGRSYACGARQGAQYSGANNNAAGVAVMLEMARTWVDAGYRPAHTIVFAAWGDGELEQLGRKHFFEAGPYSDLSIYGDFELDKLGAGDGYFTLANARWETEGHLISALVSADRTLNGRLKIDSEPNRGEPLSYGSLPVPTVFISRLGAEEVNLPDSIVARVEPAWLQSSARLVALSIMALAE
jgi:uncharacterized protein